MSRGLGLARRRLRTLASIVCALGLGLLHPFAGAVEVRFEKVTDGVYVHIGDLGGRTKDNEALNANIGMVLTPAGALLIDSGASYLSARDIEHAAHRVSNLPIRWVINTGGQDHRWLGNGYFQSRGAELIAHASAVPDMRARAGDQLQALQGLLGPRFEGTQPVYPDRLLNTDDARLDLGGLRVELRHRGGGHTPGDLMVWLPERDVVFTGDIVYTDRLLAVLPVSRTRPWLEAFGVVEAINPRWLIPGHGRPSDLTTARRHTRDYLQSLRMHMKRAVDDMQEIGAAIRSFDPKPFLHLHNAAELHPGNASRVYLDVERE
ncbi:MBL fold metallo-hydrolase [Hydrogenophaga sp.]|uniref:MBL fold metallo-hydrolase n=1 Tax=Hydrogenophaga sp. TaxID=1904254 RepID=UPI001ACAC691|nr:MBL fold metallo-hydrolase [Hydrogenophaga sp.]MBN9369444.1 MBL fold metallo-hydrolase [Hydrogenophaga sp.]